MRTLIRHNYDLVATASTAGVLLIVHAPWPLWAVWGGILAYQIGNRARNGWAR
ncbi:MAG: hypothetical protein JST91_04325 [Actinobacteria bacterium]|nr:hypothetical protein [Actinomycetota bacterium]